MSCAPLTQNSHSLGCSTTQNEERFNKNLFMKKALNIHIGRMCDLLKKRYSIATSEKLSHGVKMLILKNKL